MGAVGWVSTNEKINTRPGTICEIFQECAGRLVKNRYGKDCGGSERMFC